MGKKVVCILCEKSGESKITGALSTKDSITAHQNCLNSPEFDDLFGFSVEDVENEVKRGRRLFCDVCKQRGATAGCEVKRCKKSYHYPCAVQSGAEQKEDEVKGIYSLFCNKHSQQRAESNGNVSTVTDSETQTNISASTSFKVLCLVCEKKEGSISLESLNNDIKLYCDKHKPSSWKKEPSEGHEAVAGPSCHNSDSNSSSGFRRSKRQLSPNNKQEGTPSKQKVGWKRKLDSDSDEDTPDGHMAMFAPLESDLSESINSTPEQQNPKPESTRNGSDIPLASTSGNHLHQCKEGDKDDSITVVSDSGSESLLQPASIFVGYGDGSQLLHVKGFSPGQSPGTCLGSPVGPDQHTATGPRDCSAGPTDHPPSPVRSEPPNVPSLPPHMSSPISAAPHVDNSASISPPHFHSSPIPSPHIPPPFPLSLPSAMPSGPEPSYDSASFWKGCNEAGCTHAIFSDFIAEMNKLSHRIQSGQASQEDYNLSLRVMEASGKLPELVAKQEEDMKKRQEELQRAVAAMKKVRSALKR